MTISVLVAFLLVLGVLETLPGRTATAKPSLHPDLSLILIKRINAGVLGQKRGLLFPWDSVAADLSGGSFTKAKCPKAVSYIDWESWSFGPADPLFEFIAMARTQNDVAALATYLQTDKAKKIAFLNVRYAVCLINVVPH